MPPPSNCRRCWKSAVWKSRRGTRRKNSRAGSAREVASNGAPTVSQRLSRRNETDTKIILDGRSTRSALGRGVMQTMRGREARSTGWRALAHVGGRATRYDSDDVILIVDVICDVSCRVISSVVDHRKLLEMTSIWPPIRRCCRYN